MAEPAKEMDQAVRAMTEREGKYLTFTLDNEEYLLDIDQVLSAEEIAVLEKAA